MSKHKYVLVNHSFESECHSNVWNNTSLAIKFMKADNRGTAETLVYVYQNTKCCIHADGHLQNYPFLEPE